MDRQWCRWGAGQAVVQFVTHEINKVDYAVKFIVTRRTFLEESAQYTDPSNPLRQFLPQVPAPFPL